jgi:DNA (cytosine-5)-methyltransferase 1
MRELRLLSLFSGCGGMDLGFEGGFLAHEKCLPPWLLENSIESQQAHYVKLAPTRFRTVFANDIFADAKTAWASHFTKRGHNPEIYRTESIVDLVRMHQAGLQVFPANVDIVTGGFPCQDFSLAGKRKGFCSHRGHDGKLADAGAPSEETRGKLYYWMKKVIEITKPKIFIAENVKGLVNLSDVKDIIQSDFASADSDGYIVLDPRVLHSADFGVPQSRERVIFIGLRKSALRPETLEKLAENPCGINLYPQGFFSKENYVKLKHVIGDLCEPEQSADISHAYYSRAKYMGKHCQGQQEINLESIGPTIRAEHHGNIEFRRLSAENGGRYGQELSDGKQQRRLSLRECGLIQTFPPDYNFVIPCTKGRRKYLLSPSQAYKVVGNAVPPLLAYNIALRIESLWDKLFIPQL